MEVCTLQDPSLAPVFQYDVHGRGQVVHVAISSDRGMSLIAGSAGQKGKGFTHLQLMELQLESASECEQAGLYGHLA